MKPTMTLVSLVGLCVVLISGFMVVSSANAQTGDLAIPVTCKASLVTTAPEDFSCQKPNRSDPLFTLVPSSYYLMVTDIRVDAPSTGTYTVSVALRYLSSTPDSITFQGNAYESKSEHFTTPLWVVPAGWHIEANDAGAATHSTNVHITGLLTTNPVYLPLIRKSSALSDKLGPILLWN